MREILFRGKRIDNGEWVYGLLLEAPIREYREHGSNFYIVRGYAEHNDDGWNFLSYLVDEETISQYTGLTDKNGKKIFEGDIVKYGDTIHKVVFEQRNGTAYFGLVYNELETLPFGHYQDLKQIEVIGNIHDNPELLKEG